MIEIFSFDTYKFGGDRMIYKRPQDFHELVNNFFISEYLSSNVSFKTYSSD